MVLPASSAHDAPPQASWLDRLSLVFHLSGERGVMVLVRGGPSRLGDLVRYVVGQSPNAHVLVRADALLSLDSGSTAVLCLRPSDFDWLNMARPVVRGHRIILFGDAATALALAQSAFDFNDWISHRIDAPGGPPAFAVRALQSAACARAPAIAWKGGDLDEAFGEAFPGRSLVRVSAAMPYADLVSSLRSRPKTWVALTDVGDAFYLQRARWAVAETGRYGRTILVQPGADIPGAPVAHATPMPVEEAVARLSAPGIEHPARLAALLDLEPVAIERALAMAKEGAHDAQIEAELLQLRRAHLPPRDLSARRLPDWPTRVDLAIETGDLEIARHWATAWRAATNDGAVATAALARALALDSQFEQALALLREAREKIVPEGSAEERFEVLRAEGAVRLANGEPAAALRPLKSAFALARDLRKPPKAMEGIVVHRVVALTLLNRARDAENVIAEWTSSPFRKGHPFLEDSAGLYALARLRIAQGRIGEALQLLEQALKLVPPEQHSGRDVLGASLVAGLRRERASALAGLGRFSEAEAEFRHALSEQGGTPMAHSIQVELAGAVLAQGRVEEAAALLDEVLVSESAALNPAMPGLAVSLKAKIEEIRGNWDLAVELRRKAFDIQRKTPYDANTALSSTIELARLLIALRRPVEVEPLLRGAVEQARRLGDSLQEAWATTLLAMAQLSRGFAHARDTARRALAAWIVAGQDPSPPLLATLEAIASGDLSDGSQISEELIRLLGLPASEGADEGRATAQIR